MDREESYMANSLRLCINSYENTCISGYAYSPLQEEPIEFCDLLEMITKADKLFDKTGYPQSYQSKRAFIQNCGSDSVSFNIKPEIKRRPEDILNQFGKLATYDIQIISRRNTTWQGRVSTGGTGRTFRSDLELIHYLDSILLNAGKES